MAKKFHVINPRTLDLLFSNIQMDIFSSTGEQEILMILFRAWKFPKTGFLLPVDLDE